MKHIPVRWMMRIPLRWMRWTLAAALSPVAALPAAASDAPPAELSLAYSYVRANAPPDHCDCFSMNGGSGALLWNISDTIGVVGDLGVEHAANVRDTGLGLTLTSIHGGLRYTDRHLDDGFVSVFGQTLIGATRSSGALAAIANSGGGASTDFSALLGAGIDLNLNPHFSIRALELDYFLTTLPNGVNGYQSNLRASVGVVFRFGAAPPEPVPVTVPPPAPPAPPAPAAAAAPTPTPVTEAAPPPGCKPAAGFQVDADCRIIEQSVVVRAVDFEYNSVKLTEPSRATLNEVAAALKAPAGVHLEIRGYTDSTGSAAYNLRLSQRRAQAVRSYLVERGVDAAMLTARGFGMADPLASNATDLGRTQNRRVSFEVTRAPEHVKVVSEAATEASKGRGQTNGRGQEIGAEAPPTVMGVMTHSPTTSIPAAKDARAPHRPGRSSPK